MKRIYILKITMANNLALKLSYICNYRQIKNIMQNFRQPATNIRQLTVSFPGAPRRPHIFRGGHAGLLLEHLAEVSTALEAEPGGYAGHIK